LVVGGCYVGGRHNAHPFVKWAGGKGRLLSPISDRFPKAIKDKIDTYVEPFVGGGAIFFHIANNYHIKKRLINDSNKNLISTYVAIRDNCSEVIESLSMLESTYLELDQSERNKMYYSERFEYNSLSLKDTKEISKVAAKLIFLNKTCYNGLYRSNRNGGFNVPHGKHDSYCICDEENLKKVSKVLKGVIITNLDFIDLFKSLHESESDSLIYVDPPYTVAHNNNGFVEYNENIFSYDNQKELARELSCMADENNRIIVSNAVHDNIYNLYHNEAGFFCDPIFRKCVIGSEKKSRILTSEYIFTSYPKDEYLVKEFDLRGNNWDNN
jgi:DNA adenine methylase